LSADDVRSLLELLSVREPTLRRPRYAGEQFAAEIVRPDPDLHGLRVSKRRTHYVVDDCMVEMTEITADGRDIRTVAVESPDPSLVRSTIETLGLAGRPNVNVARGLKALIGFGVRRNAVIDVGTNSVKCYVGERRADGTVHTVADRAVVTRLGEGLDASGVLSEAAIRRTVDAVAALREEALGAGAGTVAIVGTAGLRRAANRDAFDDALRARCDASVEVVPGEDEARLAYLAAVAALPLGRGPLVVFDSGGGSTQFTVGRRDHVDERFSVDVGAVRVTERYGLRDRVTESAVARSFDGIARELARLRDAPRSDAVVAMGGTVTNLAAVQHALARYDPEVVHGTVLGRDEIDRQIERYRRCTSAERRQIVGLQPDRAEVILGGACIVRTVLTMLGRDALTVSDRGLRHGVFAERFA
jgi:exopolyphosphatase/guanosine-5'-triphosphate,3'-diphosphate pyrophosphatase